MPKIISPETKRKFYDLVLNQKVTPTAAARHLGFSRDTAARYMKRLSIEGPQGGPEAGAGRNEAHFRAVGKLPNPLRLEDLSSEAYRGLEDFGFFLEYFFGLERKPWQIDAANRVVEKLTDRSERHLGVMNTAPGVGKTFTFTFLIPAWIMCGGGFVDPMLGRQKRLQLGHASKTISQQYVDRLRRLFDSPRAWLDPESGRRGKQALAVAYGRFRPMASLGEPSLWSQDQFTVAQLEEVDYLEKEPTVLAVSRRSAFIGSRADYASWDDVVDPESCDTPDASDATYTWWKDIAERRGEPGSLILLVGQRLGNLDLFRRCLDETFTGEDGILREKYFHVVYPLHHETTCNGDHRQWDAKESGEGCLLDADRMPWGEVLKVMGDPNFRTVHQQEDADPEQTLVQRVWLTGGTDRDGYPAPGCFDHDRGFFDWPRGTAPLIDYCLVDPSVDNWWVIEWWAVDPVTKVRYLIAGYRRKMQAGKLLDWDPQARKHVGYMEDLQRASVAGGHGIRVWVVEQISAFKQLFQYNHYRAWRRKWPTVAVWGHETQKLKLDSDYGIQATLPMAYKTGFKRIPNRPGDPSWKSYVNAKVKELTTFPKSRTDDTVLADWFGEANLDRIIAHGLRKEAMQAMPDLNLPPYLAKQAQELEYAYVGGAPEEE